jgi:deoxyadenosine/deoxycytidine kinase
MKIISLEGNIASGKSTFLQYLEEHYKDHPDIVFVQEPVAKWSDIKDREGNTMLSKFYSNQEHYAFSFQMMAYISRLSILRQIVRESTNPNLIIITERSLFTDKYIFAKMLYDQGKIEHVNYQIYLNWFHEFADDFPIDHCIYIKTDPEVCHRRVNKRSREGENVIPVEYLQNCQRYHDDYIKTFQSIIELDGNVDIYQNKDVVQTWIDSVHHLTL